MKHRHITTLLVLGAVLGHAGQLHAQRPEIERPPRKSPEERYEDMRKSPFLAATLELIIPTAGHDYAGDQWSGRPMGYLMAAGAGVVLGAAVFGFVSCGPPPKSTRTARSFRDPWGCNVLGVVGMAGAASVVGSRIWAFVSAWKLANRTNAFYRRRLNLDDAGLALSVTPSGQLGLGASLRF